MGDIVEEQAVWKKLMGAAVSLIQQPVYIVPYIW